MTDAGGKISIVGTPIGNLGDMTARGADALRACDVICAEDTRVTGALLAMLGISKRLERLDENLMGARAADVVGRAAAGEHIAYCTDAGMPGISDPGLRLVAAAREAGVPVEVLPGASAVDTAYVSSGTTCPRFYFGGFMPRKEGERLRLLEALRSLDAALIFYESPKRIVPTLGAVADAYPDRDVAVCRELTKLHEEIVRGCAPDVLAAMQARESVRGEIVIVIDPPVPSEAAVDDEAVHARAVQLASGGETTKGICRALCEEFGLARNAAYEMAVNATHG